MKLKNNELIPLINEGPKRVGYGLTIGSVNISVDEENKVFIIKGLTLYQKLKGWLIGDK